MADSLYQKNINRLRVLLGFMKTIAVVIIVFLVGIGFRQIASAEEYDLRGESITVVLEDQKAQVYYSTKLINTSDRYLLTSLDFNIPIQIDFIEVKIDDWQAPLQFKNNQLLVDLSKKPIDLGQTVFLEITLESEAMLATVGAFDRIFIPSFDLVNNGEVYEIQIQLPDGWKQIAYASTAYTEEYLAEDQRQISIETNEPILFIFGDKAHFTVDVEWGIQSGESSQNYRLPLPVSPWSNFIFYDLDNTPKAIKDEINNEYLLLQLDANQTHVGSFSGYVEAHDRDYAPQSGNSSFLKGGDILGIESKSSPKKMYSTLLQKFVPDKGGVPTVRKNIEDTIAGSTQTSLDYANALVALYRIKGIDAEVAYGIVNYPIINENRWHFWVVYKDTTNNNWTQVDPYLEDLLSFDFFDQVNPERVMWGVLMDDTSIETLGLQYYRDVDSIVKYDAVVSPIEYNVELSINVFGQVYSGKNIPANLIIHNDGNTAVYFKELVVENVVFDAEDLVEYLVIPQGVEIIPINGAFVRNPLLNGSYELEGYAVVDINGEEQEIYFSETIFLEVDHKTIYLNSTILLLAVFISYFVIKKYTNKKNV